VSRYQPTHLSPKTEPGVIASPSGSPAPAAPAVPRGPVVIVARGNNVTVTPASAAVATAGN